MTKKEIDEALRLHKLWVEGDSRGFEQNQNGFRITEEHIQCPFCNGENKNAVVFFNEPSKEYFVYCETCGIETANTYRTKAAAIKAFSHGINKIVTGGQRKP